MDRQTPVKTLPSLAFGNNMHHRNQTGQCKCINISLSTTLQPRLLNGSFYLQNVKNPHNNGEWRELEYYTEKECSQNGIVQQFCCLILFRIEEGN